MKVNLILNVQEILKVVKNPLVNYWYAQQGWDGDNMPSTNCMSDQQCKFNNCSNEFFNTNMNHQVQKFQNVSKL